MQNEQVLTHVHGLAEGRRLVVRRLPDAGVHHENDQVLQEIVVIITAWLYHYSMK